MTPPADYDFMKFVEHAFFAIICGAASWIAILLQKVSKSLAVLHTQIAVIIERTAWHEKGISDLDDRMKNLETQLPDRHKKRYTTEN